jgi:hypothetical protein
MKDANNRGTSLPEQQQGHEPGGALETVKEKARDLASGAAGVAGQVAGTVRDTARQAWEGTKHMAAAAAETVEEGYEGFNSLIRRYPTSSVLIALGVGFLLGQALSLTCRSSS